MFCLHVILTSLRFPGNNVAAGRAIDEKSGQWFGAMVVSTPGRDNTGVVVVSRGEFGMIDGCGVGY